MALASLYSGLKSPIPNECNIGELLIYRKLEINK